MDKYIVFAGRKIPIETSYPVLRFDDGSAPSFYAPDKSLSAERLVQMSILRPELRNYCARFAPHYSFNRTAEQLFGATREEIDALGQHIYQIALHHDVTMSAGDTYNVLCTRGLSTHFCVNYDGTLYQYMDCYHMAWATGENNNHSIAIDMNNPVYPELRNDDPANGMRDIYQGKINGSVKTMLGYTEAQYDTIIALIKALITPIVVPGEEPWIPLPKVAQNCFPPISENGDVINRLLRDSVSFQGFLGHYHCSANKWDPGPAFDWLRVLSGIKGKRNSFPMLIGERGDRKNLSECGGKLLTDKLNQYYQMAETASGGWYPIGANQAWHSGIHLSGEAGTPVLNMMEGTIVAIRNVKTVDLGDPSFVLVRHQREEKDTNGDSRMVYWYSLFMHLAPMYKEEDLEGISWVKTLLLNELDVPDKIKYINSNGDVDGNYERGIPHYKNGIVPAKNHEEIREAFFRGDIILTNIDCSASEKIGTCGVFGSKPGELYHQVHVEVFSNENIFANNAQKEAWSIIEADYSDSSRVRIKKLLRPIQEYVREQTEGKEPTILKSSEIAGFYSMSPDSILAPKRDDFRKMICYHKSEWSPKMDWTKTAIQTVGWQWESEASFGKWLVLWLPFQWMIKDVVSELGLDDKGSVFTFHPIYLLEQLNKTYAGDVSQTAEVASDGEMKQNVAEMAKNLEELVALNKKLENKEELTDAERARQEELYQLMDDHMGDAKADISAETSYDYYYDEKFDQWEPGEWTPPPKHDLEGL